MQKDLKIQKKMMHIKIPLKDSHTSTREFKVTPQSIIILDKYHAKGNVIATDLPPTTTLTFQQGNNFLLTLAHPFVCRTWTKKYETLIHGANAGTYSEPCQTS